MGTPHEITLDGLLASFQEHLRRTRGINPSERYRYARYARAFLEDVVDPRRVDVTAFKGTEVIDFVVSLVDRYRPTTIRHVATALRSFFRFLQVEGLRDDRLDEVVPSAVARRLGGLPAYLDPNEIERFLTSLDRSTPCALRDRAIILCVARLGLRGSEVVRICLEDIDWRAAELHAHTRKTGRGALLPLVADVGEAIAEYIKEARPPTTSRHIFVLHHLRVGEPATSQTVSDAIRAALQRAGIEAPFLGPNLLRHTLATRLVRSGASLKEIADLLGHRRLETTQIYAKLDVDSLREVARPWPEVAS